MKRELDAEHQKFLDGRFAQWNEEQPSASMLKRKLLAIGGLAVVAPPNNFESDLDTLIEKGSVVAGAIHIEEMTENSCHQNAAQLWSAAQSPTFGIGTGFGLNHGLWRQHSWAMDGPMIVDTTEPRDYYFGVVLYGKDAELFCIRVGS